MNSCVLPIKAVPNAPRSTIVGWMGNALKVRFKAPPVDGQANAELCRFLAETLGLPKSAVTLATGTSSRAKRVVITGLTTEEIHALLGLK
jgi:uncharacterized protein (TIGR00251 family)